MDLEGVKNHLVNLRVGKRDRVFLEGLRQHEAEVCRCDATLALDVVDRKSNCTLLIFFEPILKASSTQNTYTVSSCLAGLRASVERAQQETPQKYCGQASCLLAQWRYAPGIHSHQPVVIRVK